MTDELHELFLRDLDRSAVAVAAVAAHFIRLRKYTVEVPFIFRPENREDGVPDRGDIFVTTQAGEQKVIEVKGLNYTIEQILGEGNKKGFPAISFTNKDAWDRREYYPDLVFIVSSDNNRCGMVDMSKKPILQTIPIKHGERGYVVNTYAFDPPDCLRYVLDKEAL